MWFIYRNILTKGRKLIYPMFSLNVLIVCIWSYGTCIFSKVCEPNKVVNVSRFDPPRQILTILKPLIPKRLSECGVLVSFLADKETGHVCFQQLYNLSFNKESRLELKIKERNVQVAVISYCSESQKPYNTREYCSNGSSLEFQLIIDNHFVEPNPDLLYITIQVVHIESPFRVIAMENEFCESDFKLANSRVQVYSTMPKMKKERRQLCLITLVKLLQERQLCLFYNLRSEKWPQLFDWELYVSIVQYSLSPENVVYKFNSKNESSGKWCDKSNREKIYVTYETNQTEPFQSDPPVFMMLVTDVENPSTDNAASVTPWWSMEYFPTQSTSSPILSTPENGFSETFSRHSLAVILTIVVTAAIVVLFCCYLAYTRKSRTNTHEEAVTHGIESVID